MKRTLILVAAALIGAVASKLVLAAWAYYSPRKTINDAVLTVGEESLSKEDFNNWCEYVPVLREELRKPNGRLTVAREIVRLKALEQEAKRQKLDEDEHIRQEIRFRIDEVLANAEVREIGLKKSKPSEEEVRTYFVEHRKDFEIVEARHILVRIHGSLAPPPMGQRDAALEEALAKAGRIRHEIVSGQDFAAVAARESDDVMTRAAGGALGTLHRGQTTPELKAAAFDSREGQVSEPLRTTYGYHIIQVTRRSIPAFLEVHDEITEQLRKRRAKEITAQVINKTRVRFNAAFFDSKN